MANFWMHNGFLQVEGDKMSKSLGNFVTIRDLLDTEKFGGRRWSGETLRLAILSTHYRQPLDFTQRALDEVLRTQRNWRRILEASDWIEGGQPDPRFLEALGNDLNTPAAIAVLHELAVEAKGNVDSRRRFLNSAQLIGLLLTERYFSGENDSVLFDAAKIESMINARSAARARKDFKESDRIRDELTAMGVLIKDSREGTTWEIAR
jgi:cysteinyl-tRNA synthetase